MIPSLTARIEARLTVEVRITASLAFLTIRGDPNKDDAMCHAAWQAVIVQAIAPVLAPAWQDIASAPKDGTEILLSGHGQVCAGLWSYDRSAWESPDGLALYIAFTHWKPMPLPAPPAGGPRP